MTIKIKVGQIWRTRSGEEVKVVGYDHLTKTKLAWDLNFHPTKRYPKDTTPDASVTNQGRAYSDGRFHKDDLVELIQDVPKELPLPELNNTQMKVYIIEYESPNNLFKGYAVIESETLTQAQDKFFTWLKEQPTYQHMWQLSFKIIGDNHKPFTVI